MDSSRHLVATLVHNFHLIYTYDTLHLKITLNHLHLPLFSLDPTWLQFKLFPHRLVSEIDACDPADLQ